MVSCFVFFACKCYCSILLLQTLFYLFLGGGGGAIAGCHCSVLDGWRPTLREWTWCDCWCSRRGAIAGCHFSVLGEGRVTANFGGGAIAGAIVVCYGWGEGDHQLWGSGRRAIAG